jgi:DNA sulfur modification protein DndB
MIKTLGSLHLPCLRGKIGDWFFYTSVMSFKEIAKRVKLPEEIDKKYSDNDLKLGEWIQRKIEPDRIKPLVNYIHKQDQRFFNSLVLGIYDGSPSWQDLKISNSNIYNENNEEDLNYFSKTFGILTLRGNESIFAVDGQHRAIGIRKAVKENLADLNDEISVIFVAHNSGEEGRIRTRRLFSTLNRYAKPVSESEKIALSEDDNCAVLTRKLIDEHENLKNRILLNKSRSVHPSQIKYFTSIMVLYDIVVTLIVEKNIPGLGLVEGKKKETFLHIRTTQEDIEDQYNFVSSLFTKLIKEIPPLNDFFINDNTIDRNNFSTSILFRPIGQNILFDIVKAGVEKDKLDSVVEYFRRTDFNFTNKIWHSIFWDSETNTIVTDKMRQRFVTMLILEKLGFKIQRTKNDLKILQNFGVTFNDI